MDEQNYAIIEISKAELALEKANDIHEMLDLRSMAAAYEVFANAQGFRDAAQKAKIFQLKAERKAGDWLDKNVKHEGNKFGTESQDGTPLPDGITKNESSNWQTEAKLPEEKFNDWIDNSLAKGHEISASALQKLSKDYTRKESQVELAKNGEVIEPDNRWNIWQADINKWTAPRQYDFIITDPPYPREYLPLYEILASRAVKWLKPGGLLIAMCGQSYLNQIYRMMSNHLEYYWTACYLTPGQSTSLRQKQVNTNWKPLLIFGNNGYNGKIFGDVFNSKKNDKDFHKWGQSESGMYSVISGICLPGQYILDPFCGAGTTGIAALIHGCLFDGIDIDEQNVNISKARLNDTTTEG